MNPVVIIPTFIYPRRHRGGADVVSFYDHTTPPNQPGELGRCLESLAKVEGLGLVMVLVSAVCPSRPRRPRRCRPSATSIPR